MVAILVNCLSIAIDFLGNSVSAKWNDIPAVTVVNN